MHIVSLQAENIKRLVAVSIRPDGNLVEITGRNGQGKTSVLDAIWWCLAGKDAIQATPIRKECEEASISLDLGRLKVRRTFRAKEGGSYTTSITVENDEGARFGSPQGVLDALLGELTFDPLAFTKKDAKGQFEALRRFVPDVDFDAIDRENKADYAARTDANRRAKEARARAAAHTSTGSVPSERVDESALVVELERAGEQNAEIERNKARREAAASSVLRSRENAARHRHNAQDLRKQADEQERAAEQIEAEAEDLQAKLDNAPPLAAPVDTADLRQKIGAARSINDAYDIAQRARLQREEYEAEAAAAEAESAALTRRMAERDEKKRKAVAAASMPVPGLEFGDGIVLLNGVPFDQGSDAEQLRTSIAIAMAMNPKLRVIRVRDGSLLDEESMKILAGMAEDKDYQVWVETVSSGRPHAVLIEDGHVASASALQAAE